ncbi:hypothetical protein JYU06_04000 [Desulfotalea psychrophila]|uniref:Uncharacterized protein n=1 Tax=Desulfotalea psychrophila TaxID=84980 RepID=A0ABS3AXD5_9BACT|nr:hypothetical protein [Desulfotalea psychrophila]
MANNERSQFEIEKEIYNTQWSNIRQHWQETIISVRYLSTLVIFAIFPLKFLKVTNSGTVTIGIDHDIAIFIKLFLMVIIFIMGLLTFLNQLNHHKRSKEARTVVVAIEKKWNLYENNKFKYQENNSNYCYSKFSGGEFRLTHSVIQFAFIIVITLVGLVFVLIA